MEIVFLNRFERTEGTADAERGQVYIGENQGIWSAGWHSFGDQGEMSQDNWYEGTSWEELLAAFRFGVARKMREGYRPLIDGMLEDAPFWERRPPLPALLQCYADQFDMKEELEPLRIWRRTKAAEDRRAAYMIATNRELQLLAVFVPRTIEELKQIPGFGKAKIEKYGEELIGLIREMPRDHVFPLDWVASAVSDETLADWTFRQKEEKYGKSLTVVQERKKLLTAIRQGLSVSQLEKELGVDRRMLVERIDRLDEEGYDVLPLVEQELSAMDGEELSRAEAALAELGDRYLKPVYQRLYAEAENGGGQETALRYEKLRMVRIRFRRTRESAV
ncbi:HRDC domain-containing protein [Cohnella lubricantis]|uniref:HRDC domain-containing protein n=1 Tax=Cohnella lubricantis TaxID=2163172 RepID=A0A841T9C6_9BACL|nr:HRDC domain-containing protein [Cohnella lubricantis]MBB6678113.1 HRDC domain-containing protein [Cohnella lubricantis]MBP2116714.1 biotin operon repressor [Cohnella lubricantis]